MDIVNSLWNLHQEQRINEVEGRAISADYSGKFAELKSEDVKVQYLKPTHFPVIPSL